jgi:ATP-dependent DNA helicase DinG
LLRRRKGKITGLYPALSRSMGRSAHVKRVPDLIGAVEKAAEYLDDACMSLLGDQAAMLLDPAGREAFASSASGAVGGLSQTIRDLGEIFQELFERMDAMGERPEAIDGAGSDALVAECRAQLARLGGVADICDRFRSFDLGKDDIFWLESLSQPSRARANDGDGRDDARGRNRSVRFMITPMDVSPLLRKAIYEPMRTTVFTSATLTVAGSFTFWAGRIGLRRDEAREPVFNTFPSPFDYRENVLFGVPTDAPMPDSAGYKTFLASFIGQSLLASRGAGLVLFTSHALMREIYPSVREILSAHAIPVLKQGDDERARLLDAFRGERSSVLFATDSFWEGIDAPGETLQMVILSRLPFRVPSEPVLRARMTDIEEKGGNPFAELSLPDAIIRLRQGFGRLMRRQDDRGVVLLLDSRIVSRWYGSLFFDSLPPARRLIAPSAKVLRHVREFFGKKRGEEDLDASSSPLGDS